MSWVSIDVEADGPIPGDYSMIALGAVLVDRPDEVGFSEVLMIVLKHTEQYGRTVIDVNRYGVHAKYQRRRGGGGWYIKNSVTVPWPWRKVNRK